MLKVAAVFRETFRHRPLPRGGRSRDGRKKIVIEMIHIRPARQQELDDYEMPPASRDLKRRVAVTPVLDEINRHAVIQKSLDSRKVAIRRSASQLTKTPIVKTPTPDAAPAYRAQKQMSKGDYLNNVRELNFSNGMENTGNWEKKMKSEGQGVKAEKAFKK